jgi:type I restriction enzyme M protein
MPKAVKKQMEVTTTQRLSSLLKSVRDIMRKDKGLNGDADRLPMLTWMMFLKFLDDLEIVQEADAQLEGKVYRPVIEAPYRWRDWASEILQGTALTGDDLIAFINNDEAMRPDGQRGAGLFAYLRSLQGESQTDRRNVIATVFKGTINRMINGYLMREVLQRLDTLHFTSSEETYTLGQLYESLLKEMRDAAGDGGEFYTPRAVVKLMVKMIDPQLRESIYDPACGTGGFLVEAFEHLRSQVKNTQEMTILQTRSIYGGEAKPLPYLLAQMNLTLHGLEAPQIDSGNSLRHNITQIGDDGRYDVILANPPFGGEEERGIQNNFPPDKRTSETALLFIQLIMQRLKRKLGKQKGGRAAIVVPNGTLFAEGVAARIKQDLLENFNLHTIVRLPNGIFAPYTSIPTNLLFFDRNGSTEDIWYYEQPLPEGRKNYTKTQPIQYEEFEALTKWWDKRTENERAWKVSAKMVAANGYNLDIKNPNAQEDFEHMPPEQLLADITQKEERILELLGELKAVLRGKVPAVLEEKSIPVREHLN